MRKAVLIVIVSMAGLGLNGCSNSNNTASTTTTSVAQGELSNADPWLQSKKFVREQITDPALYAYLSSSGLGNVSSQTRSNLTSEEQNKIGKIAVFTKSSKYGISGSAEIKATDVIDIKNFTYNGACGTVSFNISASNAIDKPVATLKSITNAVPANSGNFSLTIPSNISLIQFNNVNITCQNVESPVSQAIFN